MPSMAPGKNANNSNTTSVDAAPAPAPRCMASYTRRTMGARRALGQGPQGGRKSGSLIRCVGRKITGKELSGGRRRRKPRWGGGFWMGWRMDSPGLCTNILFHVSLEKKCEWRSKKCLVCIIFIKESCSEGTRTSQTSYNIFGPGSHLQGQALKLP